MPPFSYDYADFARIRKTVTSFVPI